MNITDTALFGKTKARIVIILLPRLLVLLFLFLQDALWQQGVFLKDQIPLSILIAADLLISIFYTFGLFKKIIKNGNRTITDTLFFFYSVIVCYFMVFTLSMPGLFGPRENPYENILFVAVIQLLSLGCMFLNLCLRLTPKSFSKRPYLALGLGMLFLVMSLILQSLMQTVFTATTNIISPHIAALGLIFYSIVVFYLLYTGGLLCYRKYLKSHKIFQVMLKILIFSGLILFILLAVIFQDNYSPYNVIRFLAPGLFRLASEYSLVCICFFSGITGLIVAAATKNNFIKKIIFALLCVTLPINAYTAIILLPVFSLIPLLAIFYPIILLYFFPYLFLLFHVQALLQTRQAFKTKRKIPLSKSGFITRVVPMISILPLFIFVNSFLDKAVLHEAYYSMNNSAAIIRLDGGRLQNILDEIANKRKDSYLPFITPLRRAIILENKNLDSKEAYKLYRFYVGYEHITYVPNEQRAWPREVTIKNISEMEFSDHGTYMQSKVLIEIENPNQFMDEFYRIFEIPPDVFITDLSLWIDDNEKKGLLARKASALTVYTDIMRSLRDPALLTYQNDGSCSLRVFPVEAGQKRQVAITFMYRRPFALSLGDRAIRIDHRLHTNLLPDSSYNQPDIHPAVSHSMYKNRTEQVLHFIIDCSNNSDISLAQAVTAIQNLIHKNKWQGPVRFSLANYNWQTYDSLDQLQPAPSLYTIPFRRQGAFIYSRVLPGLLQEYESTAQTPLFVIISNTNQQWVIHSSLLPYKINYPVLRQAYRADSSGELFIFPVFAIHNEQPCDSFLHSCYSIPVVQKNQLAAQSRKLTQAISEYSRKSVAEIMRQNTHLDAWETNALLFTLWSYGEILHTGDPARHARITHHAQKQGLLLPFLSYIVLENTEQENILKELDKNAGQTKLLSDGKLKSVTMSEPPLFLAIVVTLILLCIRIITLLITKKQ